MRGRRSIDYLLSERERKSLAILELIRKKGPISRTDIAKSVDTNIVTVSNYIDSYIRKGLVFESGLDISSGGRKPTLVELNSKAGFAIGVDLSVFDGTRKKAIALVCDLAGREIAKIKSAVTEKSKDKLTDVLSAIINKVIKKAGIEKDKLRGIGAGIGTLIPLYPKGHRRAQAGTSGEDMEKDIYSAVKEDLKQSFELPVFTGNDATFAAFGEKMLGLRENFENILYMYSDIGCGIIIKGNVYCGVGGSAGEIGVSSSKEEEFFCSSRGPCYLKPKGKDLGISSQAKRVISEGVESKILKLAKGELENVTLDLVIEAAKGGDRLAEELIENAGVGLGIRIAYLVNLFNPEVVVIGGGIEAAGNLLLEPLRKTVKKWVFEGRAEQTKIVPARLGEEAVVRGAAGIVVREVFIQA